MPIDKQSSFVHIDSWQEFKDKLICDFGNTEVFRCEDFRQFCQLDQLLQTTKKLTDQLVPAVNTLKSHIKCVAAFYDPIYLYANTLFSSLNNIIISCLPITVRKQFLQQLLDFQLLDPQNKMPPAIFNFISE